MTEAATKLSTDEMQGDASKKIVVTTVERDAGDRSDDPMMPSLEPGPSLHEPQLDGSTLGRTVESAPADAAAVSDTPQSSQLNRTDYAQEALKFMRKGADSLKKGAEEARKGANRLIEKSRQVSIPTPNWTPGPLIRPKFSPRADFSMDAGAYEIAVELPGLDEKDVHVKLSNGQIVVSGEKRNGGTEGAVRSFFFQERQFGRFERSFRRPDDADPSKIEARFERNVLKIILPKFAEAIGPEREIEVKKG